LQDITAKNGYLRVLALAGGCCSVQLKSWVADTPERAVSVFTPGVWRTHLTARPVTLVFIYTPVNRILVSNPAPPAAAAADLALVTTINNKRTKKKL